MKHLKILSSLKPSDRGLAMSELQRLKFEPNSCQPCLRHIACDPCYSLMQLFSSLSKWIFFFFSDKDENLGCSSKEKGPDESQPGTQNLPQQDSCQPEASPSCGQVSGCTNHKKLEQPDVVDRCSQSSVSHDETGNQKDRHQVWNELKKLNLHGFRALFKPCKCMV